MAYPVIDSKTGNISFGTVIKEDISTTLVLVEISHGKFAINYQVRYSGIKWGNTVGGPINVSGNINAIVSADPKVLAVISDFADSGSIISMHITIWVDIPGQGTKIIFDETLGGEYGTDNLMLTVKHIAEISK